MIYTDVLIVGGGMVGLSTAYQLLEHNITSNIIVIDKEAKLGLHSSGRNSGVLHSGLYYKPDSLKASVCVDGQQRLRKWIEEQGLPLNPCGKVIVPQRYELDSKLDLLAKRGTSNGAKVEILDEHQLHEIIPFARSASGRALWTPSTVVVKPLLVIKRLMELLQQRGVRIMNTAILAEHWQLDPNKSILKLHNNERIMYKHLFNCAGANADTVAHLFGVGLDYRLLPFKGLYWQIKSTSPFQLKTNLYPVPDLNVPFLGVHFTPSADRESVVSIGPTAIPALGRENYNGMKSIELFNSIQNFGILSQQYIFDRGGFRKYVHEQLNLSILYFMLRSAKLLIPNLSAKDIEPSDKVGIRAQLFNNKTQRIEEDFICLEGEKSTHVLNAISPAFTASFALADLILKKSTFSKNISS